MAADSLGKKTHLACVVELYNLAPRLWPQAAITPIEAAHKLGRASTVKTLFERRNWPFDRRSQQAYVHRFFGWLNLKKEERLDYPTLVLSGSDSVPFRQCLWTDFAFGTPEARKGMKGLWHELVAGKGSAFLLSPDSHRTFCDWLGIPESDNTRRGPFARWLEDAGLATPLMSRGKHATSVMVELTGGRYATPEAVTYALLREFGGSLEDRKLRPVSVSLQQLYGSVTQEIFLISDEDLPGIVQKAANCGYLSVAGRTAKITWAGFARALRKRLPYPSLDWIDPTLSEENTLDRAIVDQLKNFPPDAATTTNGSVFETNVTRQNTERRVRDVAFPARVGAAYKHQCCFSGFKFRAPNGRAWYGQAAHIVPHEGKDKAGKHVYGSSFIANGIYLSHFMHWCFDRGWITAQPIIGKRRVRSYKLKVASMAADDVFKEESETLLDIDDKLLPAGRLPDNPAFWPSVEALAWHQENIFLG